MQTQTFSKFVRPEEVAGGRITDRDLDIIESILRYRFIPTSELVRLVGGNEDVTLRRLRRLWEKSLINRAYSDDPDHHSDLIPISLPEEADQVVRSEATLGF